MEHSNENNTVSRKIDHAMVSKTEVLAKEIEDSLIKNPTPRRNMANFIFSAMVHVKNTPNIQKKLKKKEWNIRLALDAVDFKPAVLLYFCHHELYILPISDEDLMDKSKWDIKIESDMLTFLDFFLHKIGIVRPILLRKMKVKGLLKMPKILWFIFATLKAFKKNQTMAKGMAWHYLAIRDLHKLAS